MTSRRRATGSATVALVSTCVLLVGLVLGVAGPAAAHNVLVSMDPVQGATIPEPPPQIPRTFGDDGTVLQVTGPDGVLNLTGPQVTGSVVTQRVPAGLPGGQYSTLWRVTSADGHAIDGTLAFTAEPGPGSASAAPTTTPAADDDANAASDAGMSPLVWALGGIAIVVIAAAWISASRSRSR